MRPSSTKLYSSSRVCRWSGAASARGDIGCSTSEKRSPVSSPSIRKRTPMLPRKPSRTSSGLTIFTPVVAVVMSSLLSLYVSVNRLRRAYTSATVVSSEMAQSRKYELQRRAERQEETRRRIIDAAVELHTTRGPSRTTVQAIAETAGVTRPTVYAHFPDERSLFEACSGHVRSLVPPRTAPWHAIADPGERLATALACAVPLLRAARAVARERRARCRGDADHRRAQRVPRPVSGGGARPSRRAVAGAPRRARAPATSIGHALEFGTWQSLVRRQGCTSEEAIRLMVALAGAAAAQS